MNELPGNVFVSGQLLPAQIQALADQGMKSFINNRPDQEEDLQPLSKDVEQAASEVSCNYFYIPMGGGLTPDLIAESVTAYASAPRPIVAFCRSGMRSTALWAFAHVDMLGVDTVLDAARDAGYQLEQLRTSLMEFAARDRTC